VALVAAGVATAQTAPTRDQHRQHPGRQLAAHPGADRPLQDRIADITPVVLAYVHDDNAINGFANRPKAHVLNDVERQVMTGTLAALPMAVRMLVERYVAGIYVVDDLGSSAMAEYLDPPTRKTFLVFDAQVLHETPNAWATRKERSGFHDGVDLRLEIADAKDNSPGGAFRFIFLHEFGHAVGHGLQLHPTWIESTGGEFPFAKLVADQKPIPRRVPFYAIRGNRLPASLAKDIYAHWSTTAYPTMYATFCLDDDFAESFVSYVHITMLRQPYRLFVGDQRYDNGIIQPRCANKRDFIAKLLEPL
jgi:hypothetical protein